ncbi:uncharacterized protein LOC120927598 [Rana temporaria]|uniref:uncharacterized protein LOC120927598 n=1 Tax=Rana temporaria TaxID=8407 RepID=UPI001AAC8F31|nr:uncharacterized protein LOC120927598 [Rana temporaria]
MVGREIVPGKDYGEVELLAGTKCIRHQGAVSRVGISIICTRHVWNVWYPSPCPSSARNWQSGACDQHFSRCIPGTAHLSGSPAAVLQWQALCSCSVLKLPVEELLKLAIVHLENPKSSEKT